MHPVPEPVSRPTVPARPSLILASGSAARQSMLRNANLQFQAIPADIDEKSILAALHEKGETPQNIAAELAQQKALHVAAQNGAANPGTLVIGADQVLWCGARLYSKAQHIDEAREILRSLRGREHSLTSAVCVVEGDRILWSFCDTVRLAMKNFDDAFLDDYITAAGLAVLLGCVGCYAIEGVGTRLFDRVEGSKDTVMGLPLRPLLQFLEGRGFNHGH